MSDVRHTPSAEAHIAGSGAGDRSLHARKPMVQAGSPAASSECQPRPVFLHTGWRSCGTWMWASCRQQPMAFALYEPLHEHLASLGPAEIASLRPGSWASNHGATGPYFEEYGRFLHPRRRGVPLYRERFAYDRFFMDAAEDDPELEAYLHALLHAAAPGQVGVLKFCRSQGRVAWMEQRFPDALHAVVIRDPRSQWASARALLGAQRNRYFLVAPLLVLARNAAHPLVRDVAAALGVELPRLRSRDLAYGLEICWWRWRWMAPAAQYRAFLAFWTVSGLQALRGSAMLVEAGRLACDAAYRGTVETALRGELGAGISLDAGRETAERTAPPDAAAAHRAAHDFLVSHGAVLTSERLGSLLGCLNAGEPVGAGQVSVAPATRPGRGPPTGIPLSSPGAPSLLTPAAVLFARALQPMRRLHGRLVRRSNNVV